MSEEVKELPKGWINTNIGNVSDIFQGYGFPKKIQGQKKGKYAFYKVGDISKSVQKGKRYLDVCENYIDEDTLKSLKAKPYPKDTIVFAKIGEALKLNRRAIIDAPGIVDNNAVGIKAKSNLCDDLFLFYFFKTVKLGDYSRSTTVPSIRKSDIEEISFMLPLLREQKVIVSKIEELFNELDKGIENLKATQQQLKIYRQSVLKWAFEGRLTNKNVKDGELPKGWRKVKVCQVAIVNPKLPNKENLPGNLDVQFVPMKLVEELINKVHLIDIKKLAEVQKGSYTPFINGDILFAKVTPCMENGKVAIAENLKNGIGFGSSEFHVIRCSDDVQNKFLFYFLVQDFFRTRAESAMTGAVGLRRVPKQFVESHLVPLPQKSEQEKISKEIESRFSIADHLEESIKHSLLAAEALKQSILKQAFDGKLVKEVAPAKPANVYMYQVEILAYVTDTTHKRNLPIGEMVTAKYTYLIDKLYNIPTYYNYKRWHLGPYAPEINKAIKKRAFFKIENHHIKLVNKRLLEYSNPYKEDATKAINELLDIFAKYPDKERSHKVELLATVCKVIEDIKSTELDKVRASMKEWVIKLDKSSFKNKAEKFNEKETASCIKFIIEKGWDKKLIV